MKHSVYILMICCAGIFFSSCETEDKFNDAGDDGHATKPTNELDSSNWMQGNSLPDYLVDQLWSFQKVQLGNFGIEFIDRNVTGAQDTRRTTFRYKVIGPSKSSEVDEFYMKIPDCAGTPIDWSPAAVSVLQGKTIRWNKPLASNEIQEFSVTFEGDVPLGIVNVSTSEENRQSIRSVLGPCTGIRTISGYLFIDANEDGEKQNVETGVGGIPVNLLTPDNGPIATVFTADDGFYSFSVVNGDYKLSARGSLLEGEYFIAAGSDNVGYSEVEFAYIDLPGVANDASDQNFAYHINRQKIIEDLEDDVLETNTEPTAFWISEFTAYRQQSALYSEMELREFLVEIEKTLLFEPFQFGEDKEGAALDILLKNPTTEYEEFLKQLLTAELNVVSGRGVLKNPTELHDQFNSALLIYSEAVACREGGNCAEENALSSKAAVKAVTRTDTQMLIAFNGTGGI
ncbi:SdrD B-like domain-containing protein [Salinimicrobium sp. GXAS 041]|uniref:SdrD B-like domain-containing protein n=1 Tax=Salinimicrobium sp. GXAS 041 TaxID=3400806 RepID=UPI003C773121